MERISDGLFYFGRKYGGPMRESNDSSVDFYHPFFKGFTDQQRRTIAGLSRFVRFDTGDLILKEGEPANRFYLLETGKVDLQIHIREVGVVTVDEIHGGDVLGWSWLYEPYLWQFDARAFEPTTAWFVYGTRLRQECEHDAELGYAVMTRVSEVLLHRLQSTRRRLVEFASAGSQFAEAKASR